MPVRLSVLDELPQDVRTFEGPDGVLAVNADLADAFLAAGFAAGDVPRLEPSDLIGKRRLQELRLDAGTFVVRRFHHGGLLRWITGSRFLDAERPFRELLLQRALASHEVSSPEVVAARAVRAAGGGWRLAVVTRRVPDTIDLALARGRLEAGELGPRAWRCALRGAGRLVARLHEIGFTHADLTPRNLLVELGGLGRGPARLWVLDLDRSRLGPLDDAARRANLRRLQRHVDRLGRERALPTSVGDQARFLKAYQPARAERHEDWCAIAALRERRRAVHSAGWILERRLGRGRSGAEAHLGRGERAARDEITAPRS